jgi:hypothetical protein
MVASQPAHDAPRSPGLRGWIGVHLPALLYGWFWLGMMASGLLAPTERVVELQSSILQKGWHISVLALLLGTPPVLLYIWRMSATEATTQPRDASPL